MKQLDSFKNGIEGKEFRYRGLTIYVYINEFDLAKLKSG